MGEFGEGEMIKAYYMENVLYKKFVSSPYTLSIFGSLVKWSQC